jgi:hypothetical protein
MSDLVIFIIGVGVTSVVGSAVGLLVYGASQERYVSGRHRGDDLLDATERFVCNSDVSTAERRPERAQAA